MGINWRVLRDLDWTDDLVRRLTQMLVFFALAGFALTASYEFWRDARRHLDSSSSHEQEEILLDQLQKTRSRIAAVENSVQSSNDTLAQVLAGIKSQPTGSLPSDKDLALLRGEITSLKSDVAAMHTSLDALDAALLTSPDKALSVPLLRKDLDDFRAENQRDVDSIRLEMGRAYELNKWLMGFLLAAVLGMIINNLIQSKNSSAAQQKS